MARQYPYVFKGQLAAAAGGLVESAAWDVALSLRDDTVMIARRAGDDLSRSSLSGSNSSVVASHGTDVSRVAIGPAGELLFTASSNGDVRVGPLSGEEPHLLLGHTREIWSLAVDPSGQWVATGDRDGVTRLSPVPRGQPFHTLPYEELLAKIRALTNYGVVPDAESDTGYTLEIGPFPGWETVPTW